MANKDIRWIQRFSNYRKALTRLTDAIELRKARQLSELEQQGLIQAFEFTYDLAWKTLQDLLRHRHRPNDNGGPAVIIKQSIEEGYIRDKEGWKELKKARELTSHSYDEETANEIAREIAETYHPLLIQLETRLQVEKLNDEKEQ